MSERITAQGQIGRKRDDGSIGPRYRPTPQYRLDISQARSRVRRCYRQKSQSSEYSPVCEGFSLRHLNLGSPQSPQGSNNSAVISAGHQRRSSEPVILSGVCRANRGPQRQVLVAGVAGRQTESKDLHLGFGFIQGTPDTPH